MSKVALDLNKREVLAALKKAALEKYKRGRMPPVEYFQLCLANHDGATQLYYNSWPVSEPIEDGDIAYWQSRGATVTFTLTETETDSAVQPGSADDPGAENASAKP